MCTFEINLLLNPIQKKNAVLKFIVVNYCPTVGNIWDSFTRSQPPESKVFAKLNKPRPFILLISKIKELCADMS